jgi:hypothetical protein
VEKYGRARQATGNIIQRMRIACRATNATATHTEYVIFTAFPQQQLLRERATMLHYAYTDCPVLISLGKLCPWIHINYKSSIRNTCRNTRSFKRTRSKQAVLAPEYSTAHKPVRLTSNALRSEVLRSVPLWPMSTTS